MGSKRIIPKWTSRISRVHFVGDSSNTIEVGESSVLRNCFFLFKGRNNKITIGKGVYLFGLSLEVNGDENCFVIGDSCILGNCTVFCKKDSNENSMEFGTSIKAFGLSLNIEDNGNSIRIGDNTTFEMNDQIAACEGTNVYIGRDCMFSHDIQIRTTDSHGIYYKGERINSAKDVMIGDHVWIGMQCLVLKGAKVPDGSVVGARSTVTCSDLTPASVIVGSPAKSVRTDIVWSRNR